MTKVEVNYINTTKYYKYITEILHLHYKYKRILKKEISCCKMVI